MTLDNLIAMLLAAKVRLGTGQYQVHVVSPDISEDYSVLSVVECFYPHKLPEVRIITE